MIKNLLKSEINDENRKRAKILFYRFLYGDDFSNESRIKKDVKNYFNEFEQLMKFKENLITKSKAKSKIESSFGNFRKLHDKEDNIWVLSHHVQSTASLIFKKALINVFENIRSARLLIPLHDGALYEINEDSYVRISNEIKNIFEQTLKEICPELTNASAEIKNFHENSILLF